MKKVQIVYKRSAVAQSGVTLNLEYLLTCCEPPDSVPEYERELYFTAAVKILKAMEEHFADWSPDTDFMIHHATGSYHNEKDRHVSMIYGDYFFAEAVYKLLKAGNLSW